MEGVHGTSRNDSHPHYSVPPRCERDGTFPSTAHGSPQSPTLPRPLGGSATQSSLGFIRTAVKRDMGCSTAELVYGTTLHLPGEFLDPSWDTSTADPASYVTRLRSTMRLLQAAPVRKQHSRTQIHRITLAHYNPPPTTGELRTGSSM